MTDRGHVYQPGEDPLAPRPMTPAQVEALVARVRVRQDLAARHASRVRWRRER